MRLAVLSHLSSRSLTPAERGGEALPRVCSGTSQRLSCHSDWHVVAGPPFGAKDIVMPPPRMQAMLLDRTGQPLHAAELPLPRPESDQILIKVVACGVCRTDLHVFDGDLTHPKLPLVLGHEIVGRIEAIGDKVRSFAIGERVGVPWLGFTDGTCFFCRSGREN